MPDDDDKDDLRATIAAAYESSTNRTEGGDNEAGPIEDVREDGATRTGDDGEVSRQVVDRNRDETGRFAPKPKDDTKPARETLALKPKDTQPAVVDPKALPVDPKAPGERVAPPAAWKGSEKVRWERLPADVQAAIKREIDTHAATAQEAAPILQTLQGQRELLEREGGGTIAGGVKKLLDLSAWASGQPEQFAATFIHQRGLNFPALAAKLGFQVVPSDGRQPQPQAQPSAIPPEILQRLQRVDQLDADIKAQRDAATQSEIESFINDPAHPYVADVQNEMIAHIEAMKRLGERPNLKVAYDRAVSSNPTVSALIAAQRTGGSANTNQQAVDAARAARAASLNGSPVPGAGSGEAPKDEDLRSTIARQVYAARGGQRV